MPLISYFMNSGGLNVVHCGNAACSSGNTINTVDTGNDRDYTSVTVGADGLPLISYFNYDEETLNVFHCDDDACNSGDDETPLEGGGQYNSVTIGADGLPLISYYGVGGLNVLHCGNADCSSGNTATAVDPALSLAGPISVTTSVTVGADDLPVISYFDYADGSLRVLHCGDVGCTSGNVASTVDTGQVGSDAALTIGVDGLPLISYDDFGNGNLKVLHCADAFCVPYFRRR